MPRHTVEPGTRLVDRYRLDTSLGEEGNTAYWRAQDELLDRPVGVCLLDRSSPGADEVLAAARQAAAITDPRFLRVLDASPADGVVYVVTEWVAARSLADLLANGPLAPAEAGALVAEIAQALAAAHQQGLAHLCLEPANILRMAHGQVKIAGLGVDAAVRGVTVAGPEEAARRDAEGCAAILYAALTARWPGDQTTTLPPAPRENGVLCAPRQVRAGVPDDLDEITVRALTAKHRAGKRPLQSPREVADLLASAHVTTRMPAITGPHGNPDDTPPPAAYFAPYEDTGPSRRQLVGRAAWGLAALLLVVGLGLAAWQLAMAAFGGAEDPPAAQPTQSSGTTGRGPVEVASATGFDPPPDGNGDENNARAERVLDGDTGTVWTTKTYFDPFGPSGIKDGVGLLLDLGEPRSVASVAIALRGDGTELELRAATERGEQPDDYQVVAQESAGSGLLEVTLDEPVEARYLLIWMTRLPQVGGNEFRGVVAEVAVRG